MRRLFPIPKLSGGFAVRDRGERRQRDNRARRRNGLERHGRRSQHTKTAPAWPTSAGVLPNFSFQRGVPDIAFDADPKRRATDLHPTITNKPIN